MSIFDKARGWAKRAGGDPPKDAEAEKPASSPMDDALAALERVIDEMERTRADAAQVLIHSPEGDRSRLVEALRGLEAKLDEARRRRNDITSRLDRTAQRRLLTEELKKLRDELEELSIEDRQGPRGVQIRDRVAEIRIEAAAIAAGSK